MVLRRAHFRLRKGLWYPDGGHQPGHNVPFDVTVKQPDARVIGSEEQDGIAVILHHDRVSAERRRRDVSVVLTREVSSVDIGSLQDLEMVTVQVPRVQVVMVIVDHDLHDLAVLEHEGVDLAIHTRIGGKLLSGRHGRVQAGHLLGPVGLIVDREAGNVVDHVGGGVQHDPVVDGLQKGLMVQGCQTNVIGEFEVRNDGTEAAASPRRRPAKRSHSGYTSAGWADPHTQTSC